MSGFPAPSLRSLSIGNSYRCGTTSAAKKTMSSRSIFVALNLAAAIVFGCVLGTPGHAAEPPKGYRKLGPGVETTIPAMLDLQDTGAAGGDSESLDPAEKPHDIVEIQSAGKQLDWTPKTQSSSTTLKVLTKDIPFRRSAWYLEFTFKPLRIIKVDMPLASRQDGRAHGVVHGVPREKSGTAFGCGRQQKLQRRRGANLRASQFISIRNLCWKAHN